MGCLSRLCPDVGTRGRLGRGGVYMGLALDLGHAGEQAISALQSRRTDEWASEWVRRRAGGRSAAGIACARAQRE